MQGEIPSAALSSSKKKHTVDFQPLLADQASLVVAADNGPKDTPCSQDKLGTTLAAIVHHLRKLDPELAAFDEQMSQVVSPTSTVQLQANHFDLVPTDVGFRDWLGFLGTTPVAWLRQLDPELAEIDEEASQSPRGRLDPYDLHEIFDQPYHKLLACREIASKAALPLQELTVVPLVRFLDPELAAKDEIVQ